MAEYELERRVCVCVCVCVGVFHMSNNTIVYYNILPTKYYSVSACYHQVFINNDSISFYYNIL